MNQAQDNKLTAKEAAALALFRRCTQEDRAFVIGFMNQLIKSAPVKRPALRLIAGGAQ